MADKLSLKELSDLWPMLTPDERMQAFNVLDQNEADEYFDQLRTHDQAELLLLLPEHLRKRWIRTLPPDDVADLLQELEEEQRSHMLDLLDKNTRDEVRALLVYAEDAAGGLMNPRFVMLRPDMNVEEAIRYIRIQARTAAETIYYVYVIDAERRLLGVVTLRELLMAARNATIGDIMVADVATIPENMDQEEVSRQFNRTGYMAMPVVDADGRVKGIITVDDIVHVVTEEATEDFHKMGTVGLMKTGLKDASITMLWRARVGWLLVLVFMNIFSGAGIAYFEDTLEAMIALAFFLPLLVDSGGNAGSQAATLMIRAMAVGDVKARDWFRLLRKEVLVSVLLGVTMAIGVALVASFRAPEIIVVVALTMTTIVVVGSLIGMSLPFVLNMLKRDPATASAPLVTSLADIAGVLIYFSIATWYLGL